MCLQLPLQRTKQRCTLSQKKELFTQRITISSCKFAFRRKGAPHLRLLMLHTRCKLTETIVLLPMWSFWVYRWIERGGHQMTYRRIWRLKFVIGRNNRFKHKAQNRSPFSKRQKSRPKELPKCASFGDSWFAAVFTSTKIVSICADLHKGSCSFWW